MPKSIITAVFLLLIASQGYSKESLIIKSDTTRPVVVNGDTLLAVSARAIRNSLQAKDSLTIMIRERDSLISVKNQFEKLQKQDSTIIKLLNNNIGMANLLIDNLQKQVDKSEQITSNTEAIVKEKDGIIKKKNKTIRKLGVALGVAIAAGIYLFAK